MAETTGLIGAFVLGMGSSVFFMAWKKFAGSGKAVLFFAAAFFIVGGAAAITSSGADEGEHTQHQWGTVSHHRPEDVTLLKYTTRSWTFHATCSTFIVAALAHAVVSIATVYATRPNGGGLSKEDAVRLVLEVLKNNRPASMPSAVGASLPGYVPTAAVAAAPPTATATSWPEPAAGYSFGPHHHQGFHASGSSSGPEPAAGYSFGPHLQHQGFHASGFSSGPEPAAGYSFGPHLQHQGFHASGSSSGPELANPFGYHAINIPATTNAFGPQPHQGIQGYLANRPSSGPTQRAGWDQYSQMPQQQ